MGGVGGEGREVAGGPDCTVPCRSFTVTGTGNHWRVVIRRVTGSDMGFDNIPLALEGLQWGAAGKGKPVRAFLQPPR